VGDGKFLSVCSTHMLFQNGFQSVLFLVTHLDALLLFGTISMGWLRRITVYELTGLICLYYTIYFHAIETDDHTRK